MVLLMIAVLCSTYSMVMYLLIKIYAVTALGVYKDVAYRAFTVATGSFHYYVPDGICVELVQQGEGQARSSFVSLHNGPRLHGPSGRGGCVAECRQAHIRCLSCPIALTRIPATALGEAA
eukprot:7458525-Pyramimonas_sp.AAC.1